MKRKDEKETQPEKATDAEQATTCPNCGAKLESRKCKLLCTRPGCGYMVTCSEW
jgi:hypothetical protein